MKILWIPQVSSKSADGIVLLDKDSNMAFIYNLLQSPFGEVNKISVLIEFALSIGQKCELLEKFDEVFVDEIHIYTNAMQERMHFNADFYKSANLEEYDVIFTNEPTKVVNIKSLLSKESKTAVVCYNHWLAFKNMQNIKYDQISGMIEADACFMNSYYAIKETIEFCSQHHIYVPTINKLQPSYLSKYMRQMKFEKPYGIVYNHRLSSDPYYRKAFNDMLCVIMKTEQLIGEEEMPYVYFTDPSGKGIDVCNIKPYFRKINLETQEQYYEFLSSDQIQLHLNTFFHSEGMWSMSTVDAGITGNICLLPKKYGYAEIFEDNYAGYCNDTDEMANVLASILIGSQEKSQQQYFNNKHLTNHSNIKMGMKLHEMLKDVIKKC